MNSTLYSSPTIETKYFLLSNLKDKKKFDGIIRTREFWCSNYYGEEIKKPINETEYKPTKNISINMKNIINGIDLFNSKNRPKIYNKSVSLRESFKLKSKNKNKKVLSEKINRNYSTKRKIKLNIIKMSFPYCKPTIKNPYRKLIVHNKNKDFIIAKNIENNKKICI